MKKVLAGLLIFSIICLAGWMIFASVKTVNEKEAHANSIKEVPEFSLQLWDSSFVAVGGNYTKKPLVLIYFNSECEYCKSEAREVVENKKQLEGIDLLFISSEPLPHIKQFGDNIGLSDLPNALFGKIDDETADKILGITSAPQLFIYNKEGKLTKQFKGSTKIEAIIKYAYQE
jgi:thiol-disulfide isomerase/thioredoxin